ncbi:MAG: sigma 54-interacting transcriptional regulator [Pseudomonadota bacterium]
METRKFESYEKLGDIIPKYCKIGNWPGRSTISDVTQQFESLQRLHQSILQAAGQGIYGIDAEGRTNFVNRAAQDILGWREEDVLGEFIHDYHHHSYRDGSHFPKEACPIYAALRDGKVHQDSNEIFWHKNGEAIPVDYISTPILELGKVTGAVILFSDARPRLKSEDALRRSLSEVESLKNALEQERDYLRDEEMTDKGFGAIVGQSAGIRRTVQQIDAVAQTNMSVLVLGESGVGKELVVREIHRRSPVCNGPFVRVNCGAVPKDLFESEFFGHERGAFSGAVQQRIGRFELANNGTLFLDEVGDIPLEQQSKLLRALQEQEFQRVGGEETRTAKVRIVAATNRDLLRDVQNKTFREDLYYRLSVFPITVPPLRQRRDDIMPLALHFLGASAAELQKQTPRISRAQATQLTNYEWPGNVRELQHVMARGLILSKGSRFVLDAFVMEERDSGEDETASQQANTLMTEETLRRLERENLIKALELANWKVSGTGGAADRLGIKSTTLEYRIKKYGVKRPK